MPTRVDRRGVRGLDSTAAPPKSGGRCGCPTRRRPAPAKAILCFAAAGWTDTARFFQAGRAQAQPVVVHHKSVRPSVCQPQAQGLTGTDIRHSEEV